MEYVGAKRRAYSALKSKKANGVQYLTDRQRTKKTTVSFCLTDCVREFRNSLLMPSRSVQTGFERRVHGRDVSG